MQGEGRKHGLPSADSAATTASASAPSAVAASRTTPCTQARPLCSSIRPAIRALPGQGTADLGLASCYASLVCRCPTSTVGSCLATMNSNLNYVAHNFSAWLTTWLTRSRGGRLEPFDFLNREFSYARASIGRPGRRGSGAPNGHSVLTHAPLCTGLVRGIDHNGRLGHNSDMH